MGLIRDSLVIKRHYPPVLFEKYRNGLYRPSTTGKLGSLLNKLARKNDNKIFEPQVRPEAQEQHPTTNHN
jgi:hypothetical protein